MPFASWFNKYYEERGLQRWLAFFFDLISSIVLFALMVLTCADVIGRYFLHSPILGATELTKIGLAVVVFTSLPVITWKGGQIVVDLIDNFFSSKIIRLIAAISSVLVAISLYFVAFRIYAIGARTLKRGIVTDFLYIPTGYVIQYIAIFSWITALGLVLFTVLNAFKRRAQKKMEK
ncbi:TRAP transporter small permease [Oligella urethralis]|nr:TRAP transporter small permease [Oligella urethralis]MDK6201906.1 TRAP transporter small permease [Oligella urethralis]SUA59993.1 TRAP-type C4-dicarboxylate transport system, small permease component [Oligella urethralis]